jgi:hypothetical protein
MPLMRAGVLSPRQALFLFFLGDQALRRLVCGSL